MCRINGRCSESSSFFIRLMRGLVCLFWLQSQNHIALLALAVFPFFFRFLILIHALLHFNTKIYILFCIQLHPSIIIIYFSKKNSNISFYHHLVVAVLFVQFILKLKNFFLFVSHTVFVASSTQHTIKCQTVFTKER